MADKVCKVPLSRGMFALVDEADYERVSAHNWYASNPNKGKRFYAFRNVQQDGRSTTQCLHRFIMDPASGFDVDHISGDGLDNRRKNLRICTRRQNLYNAKAYEGTKSGFKGVYPVKIGARLRYKGTITCEGKAVHLGYFGTPEEAHAAYLGAARLIAGEFARAA